MYEAVDVQLAFILLLLFTKYLKIDFCWVYRQPFNKMSTRALVGGVAAFAVTPTIVGITRTIATEKLILPPKNVRIVIQTSPHPPTAAAAAPGPAATIFHSGTHTQSAIPRPFADVPGEIDLVNAFVDQIGTGAYDIKGDGKFLKYISATKLFAEYQKFLERSFRPGYQHSSLTSFGRTLHKFLVKGWHFRHTRNANVYYFTNFGNLRL
jgi:hypothetical protein